MSSFLHKAGTDNKTPFLEIYWWIPSHFHYLQVIFDVVLGSCSSSRHILRPRYMVQVGWIFALVQSVMATWHGYQKVCHVTRMQKWASHQALTTSGRLGLSPDAWSSFFRGLPTGLKLFLGVARVSGLWPRAWLPHLTCLVPYFGRVG